VGERVRIVGKVDHLRRSLVYVSAYVENRDDRSRVADATATLMQARTVIDTPTR
jgi:acyl-coenzyme A thioesterase PaaI-like protein